TALTTKAVFKADIADMAVTSKVCWVERSPRRGKRRGRRNLVQIKSGSASGWHSSNGGTAVSGLHAAGWGGLQTKPHNAKVPCDLSGWEPRRSKNAIPAGTCRGARPGRK